MILPFSQYFDKSKQKPTHFAEKIWLNKDLWTEEEAIDFSNNTKHIFEFDARILETGVPKLHTIRADLKNRWQPGKLIHPVYNNRQKTQFQFAPTFKCKGTQRIETVYIPTPSGAKKQIVFIDDILFYDSYNKLGKNKMMHLANNDGFESIEDFFNWFYTDFEGKIIHFTSFRY